MNRFSTIRRHLLSFSRWSRKGYAIFASLGKEVRIAGLAIHICEKALEKSSRKGVIVSTARSFEREQEEQREEEDPLWKWEEVGLLSLLPEVSHSPSGDYHENYRGYLRESTRKLSRFYAYGIKIRGVCCFPLWGDGGIPCDH